MDDLISRQAAVDAICGECQANCIPCEYFPCGEIKAIQALPPAQPNLQPTCNNLATDTISRRAAMDALDNIKIPGNASWYPYYQQALTVMSRLPSAQPEIVRCKDCKHRPIEKDGEIMPPKEDDWKCPCLCDDYFYSWMPKDNFFCASGEGGKNEI